MLLLGLLAFATAQELDSRLALHDALLVESRGDLAVALGRYSELARTLAEDDPALVDALYWLGHGHWRLGQTDEARQALLEGIRTGACVRCRDLLERIELEGASLSAMPVVLDFTNGNTALFHPWRVQDRGTIRIEAKNGSPALEWTTAPRGGEADRLVLGLRHPTPAPTVFRLTVTAVDAPAQLEVVVEDEGGRLHGLAAPLTVGAGLRRELTVPLATLLPADGGAGLISSRLVRIWIVDRTPVGRGTHRMFLDDIELR